MWYMNEVCVCVCVCGVCSVYLGVLCVGVCVCVWLCLRCVCVCVVCVVCVWSVSVCRCVCVFNFLIYLLHSMPNYKIILHALHNLRFNYQSLETESSKGLTNFTKKFW